VRVVAVLVVLAFAALPGLTAVRGDYIKNGSDYRGAASIIESGQRPGDGIVYMANSRAQRAGIDYYLRGDTGRPGDLTLERPAAQVASLTAEEYPDAVPRVTGVSRVWLFVYGKHDDPTWARLDLRPLLNKGYQRAGLWHLSRATLALYLRRGAP
jgi:mannosyltransferase